MDSVTTLSSRTILDLRVAYTRFIQAAYRSHSSPFDATSIGFPASFSNARPVSIVLRIDVEQYWCCGSGNGFGPRNPSQNTTNTLSFQPSLTHIMGNHTFKFGGEVRDLRVNSIGGGHFLFNRFYTRQFSDVSDSTGNALAAFLRGYPSSDPNGVDNLPQVAFRWGYYAGYVQDDWKVSSRLTLNLGLRYDYESAPTERYNQMNCGFGFDQASPLGTLIAGKFNSTDCPSCSSLKGGLLFAGVGGQDRAAFDADTNNIQPRVGAAYRLFEKTIIRGGYGLFYLPQAEFGGTTGFSVSTPFVANPVSGGINTYTPVATLSNPFPSGLIQPTGASLGLLTQAGTGVTFNLPTRRIPKTHQFSFGIQQQLPWQMKLDIADAGSRSNDLLTGDFNIGGARNINVLSADVMNRAASDPTYAAFLNQSVPNPFAGLLPGTGLNGATVLRRQLLLPYPQFTGVTEGLENVGKIWYNAPQVQVEKRLGAGVTFVGAYTWSKAIGALTFLNNQDAEPTRAVTDDDRTHRLVLSGVWQLPFGKGRRFASGVGRGWEQVIGGWEYTWIATIQSGRPLSLPGNFNIVGDITAGGVGNLDRYFNTCVNKGGGKIEQPNAAHTGFEACSNPAWAVLPSSTFSLRTTPLRASSPGWRRSRPSTPRFTARRIPIRQASTSDSSRATTQTSRATCSLDSSSSSKLSPHERSG
ncbi:MAG TPA: TonB-dependent receptor [Blastocatellia bacterium]|nr:TonB-dependent receptor [Blastocatellia bacterium]